MKIKNVRHIILSIITLYVIAYIISCILASQGVGYAFVTEHIYSDPALAFSGNSTDDAPFNIVVQSKSKSRRRSLLLPAVIHVEYARNYTIRIESTVLSMKDVELRFIEISQSGKTIRLSHTSSLVRTGQDYDDRSILYVIGGDSGIHIAGEFVITVIMDYKVNGNRRSISCEHRYDAAKVIKYSTVFIDT